MKKKIVALCLCIALLAVAVVGGSLAYFTDTDEATNVFAVGNVQIVQNEQERVKNEDGTYTTDLQDFTQDQVIMPYVNLGATTKMPLNVNGYEIQIRDSVQNYVDKIVSVTNKGVSDAYVRTFIAVPLFEEISNASVNAGVAQSEELLHWNVITDTDTAKPNGWYAGKDAQNEYPAPADRNTFTMTIGEREYLVSVMTNINVLAAGESTGPCLAGFYLDNNVDCEVLEDGSLNYFTTINGVKYSVGDISKLEILVATQAVQAAGFADAWTALDEAFGEVSATNNPWA